MGLDRRAFLTLSGASLLFAASHRARAEASRRRNMKKAVKYNMVQDGETVLTKFRLLKELGFDVKLLEGDCDWPAVMKAVDEIGYEGFATAEIPGGDRERLRKTAERMDRIFAA